MTSTSDYAHPPAVLFCDFGLPYSGQMKAAILKQAPGAAIIDLMDDVPSFDILGASVLLSSLADGFSEGSVFVCVVDPDVGSPSRVPGALYAAGKWFVGPLNGIFEHTLRRWPEGAKMFQIDWNPKNISPSFHGRDLFAPMAGRIMCNGENADGISAIAKSDQQNYRQPDFPDDIFRIIYIDGFGNAITGIRAPVTSLSPPEVVIDGKALPWAGTFSDVSPGTAFAYGNSMGLIEVSISRGRADRALGLSIGSEICLK